MMQRMPKQTASASMRSKYFIFPIISLVALSVNIASTEAAAEDSILSAQGGNTVPAVADDIIDKPTPSHHHLTIGNIGKSPEYDLSSTNKPDARCKTSSLTQEKLIESVQAIIKHGDMSDKAFIEKTLKIKFGPANHGFAYSHIADGGFYRTYMRSDMPDAPIEVVLNDGQVATNQVTGKSELTSTLAFFNLTRVGAAFHNCQYLTKKQLDPDGKAIVKQSVNEKRSEKTEVKAIWDLGNVGKEGAALKVTYSFTPDNGDAVNVFEISQQVETRLKPIGEDNAK